MKYRMAGFRARKQRSGRVFYYLDLGGNPRKEIPLGSDYLSAVRAWADHAGQQEIFTKASNFAELADRYEREVMPAKAKSTQQTQGGDLKMLRQFFCSVEPAPLNEIKPHHIHQLLAWKRKTPTTANRLKRLFSHMFNMARAWGYTDQANPVTGVRGPSTGKRDVYVSDEVYKAVWNAATQPLRDAMDLAYLTGQRPGDVLTFTDDQIEDGLFVIKKQNKTGKPLRIRIEGELAELIERIQKRKDACRTWSSYLSVNSRGLPLTKHTLRNLFEEARAKAAANNPKLAKQIKAFWFYDIRAKAADDVSDDRGDQAAADLLGHETVMTTKRHYLRKGKVVMPTK